MSGPTIRLAVLGSPLSFTRSPELHCAGLNALGLSGESVATRTQVAELPARLAGLAAGGFTGANLTHPLKEAALACLFRVSEASRLSRSVNTIGFARDGWWGETTDGPGLVDLLQSLGRDPASERVVLLGAGGAARSVALALALAQAAAITVSARRPEVAGDLWRGIGGTRLVGWRSQDEAMALGEATLVINATPLGGVELPAALPSIARRALILDLVYGAEITPWVRQARAEGYQAFDGLGLLVFQARRSLALWFARPVPVEPLASAVGWPR